MKHFCIPITKRNDDLQMVYGYASTPARDYDGDIITLDALKGALPEYMKFANVRYMHGMDAVGVTKEAEVDDKGLYIGVKVVDPLAWLKVKEGVLRAFSIGGNATERDKDDPHTITGLQLIEISLVDRPANPEAVIDVFKAVGSEEISAMTVKDENALRGELLLAVNALSGDALESAVAALRKSVGGKEAPLDKPAVLVPVAPPEPPAVAIARCMKAPNADRLVKAVAKAVGFTDAQFAGVMSLPERSLANWLANNHGVLDNIQKAIPNDSPLWKVGSAAPAKKPVTFKEFPYAGEDPTALAAKEKKSPSPKPNTEKLPMTTATSQPDAKGDLRKGLMTACAAIALLKRLDDLQKSIAAEEAREGDGSEAGARFKTLLTMASTAVEAYLEEEVQEMLTGEGDDYDYGMPYASYCEYADKATDLLKMIGGGPRMAEILAKTIGDRTETNGYANLTKFAEEIVATTKAEKPSGESADWDASGLGEPVQPQDWKEKAQGIHDATVRMGATCSVAKVSKKKCPHCGEMTKAVDEGKCEKCSKAVKCCGSCGAMNKAAAEKCTKCEKSMKGDDEEKAAKAAATEAAEKAAKKKAGDGKKKPPAKGDNDGGGDDEEEDTDGGDDNDEDDDDDNDEGSDNPKKPAKDKAKKAEKGISVETLSAAFGVALTPLTKSLTELQTAFAGLSKNPPLPKDKPKPVAVEKAADSELSPAAKALAAKGDTPPNPDEVLKSILSKPNMYRA